MDSRSLRYFVAVAEHGNMLRAGKAIHVSQPALTKSVQNLEAELGAPLFERGPRGVELTLYGRVLLAHAKAISNELDRASAEIEAIKAGRAGHLRLGVANFAIEFLPRVIATLMETEPGIRFEVVDGSYEALAADVVSGALDAMVAGFPPLHRAKELVHEPLVAHEFLVVARSDHPLVRRDAVTLDELSRGRWVLANRPRAIVDMLELELRRAGLDLPPSQLASSSMTFVKAILLEGPYVSFLPRSVVADELAAGRLARLRISLGRRAETVEGIVYRADAVRPPALDLLVQAIRAEQLRRSA